MNLPRSMQSLKQALAGRSVATPSHSHSTPNQIDKLLTRANIPTCSIHMGAGKAAFIVSLLATTISLCIDSQHV